VELAEGREDQPHRQEAIAHRAGAAVVPPGQLSRQHEEAHPRPSAAQRRAEVGVGGTGWKLGQVGRLERMKTLLSGGT
jgi:hypothetical protein